MLFNSLEFIIFLPIAFFVYWFLNKSLRLQNLWVVIISYIFYGWWNWRFLILIALTTFCSYSSGLLLEQYNGRRNIQKLISASNIVLNLSILGVFKYYNFFAENLKVLFEIFGFHLDWATLHILLPVGISFYTFQALSYTIDVYQGKLKATKDIIAFYAFISFFPQLVAGPIERATNLLPQFFKKRRFDYKQAVDGSRQILWGFLKKVVIADNCASTLIPIWDNYDQMNGIALLIGGLLFTFQIYGDFSGYSDIAIGTARLFGINLMKNFNFPYFSRSIPEFWRRWHISLMTWFRDYVYFPLGGSRCSKAKIIRNVFVIWGISGLWHGANWTFICWGLYHGTLLAFYNLFNVNTKYNHVVAYGKFFPSIKELMQMIITFMLAVVGWIIFRAENISQAGMYIYRMFTSPFEGKSVPSISYTFAFIIILMISEWIQRDKDFALQINHKGIFRYRPVRWLLYMTLLFVILVFGGSQSQFIYFQF